MEAPRVLPSSEKVLSRWLAKRVRYAGIDRPVKWIKLILRDEVHFLEEDPESIYDLAELYHLATPEYDSVYILFYNDGRVVRQIQCRNPLIDIRWGDE